MNVDVASMLGYDPTKSLSKQTNSQTGGTWAAYYWDIALNNAKTVYAMYDKAVKENFTLPEDYAGTINQNMMNIQLSAAFSGSDTNTLLRSIYGNGANEKTYREFLETKALATAYYQNHQDTRRKLPVRKQRPPQKHWLPTPPSKHWMLPLPLCPTTRARLLSPLFPTM